MANSLPQFHSPDELLATAKDLLARDDPALRRAIVLESITALETLVQHTVFRLLERKLPAELVEWLKDKTRMDFDARLSVLTPYATGQPVDRQSPLWSKYKNARTVRHAVTHLGKRVSQEEAAQVIATVEAWIVFLGQTVDVDLSLADLKAYLESRAATLRTEQQASNVIVQFYSSAKGARLVPVNDADWRRRPDVVLGFGADLVPLEVKTVFSPQNVMNQLMEVEHQAYSFLERPHVSRAVAVLLFADVSIPEHLREVKPKADGRLSFIGVSLPYLQRPRRLGGRT